MAPPRPRPPVQVPQESEPATPPEESLIGVNPIMISSLPPIVSGADVYVRQFYRDNKLPWRRYLPIKGL
jgi:hypothetical protein